MPTYWDVLAAAQARLQARPELADWQVKVRRKPAFRSDADELPLVLVTPNDEMAEREGGQAFGDQFLADYDVYVSLLVASAMDNAAVRLLAEARNACRLALFVPTLDAVPSVYDCAYDPLGRGGERSAFPPSIDSVQMRFVYRTRETRAEA